MDIQTVEVPLSDIPEGRPFRVVVRDRRAIIVCKEDETYAVFLDRCPHKAMSLRHGTILEGKLVCPYHQYQFALEDGSTNMRRCESASLIPFEIKGDTLFAEFNHTELDEVYLRPV